MHDEAPPAPLRVGLIGGGPWASSVHVPGLADHPGTTLSAIWTRRPEVARELAEANGAVACADVDELFDAVDAVALAVPPAIQSELGVRAAKAGKHLILEKPIAADVAGAQRLADAVTESGVVALVVLTLRYSLQTQEWLSGLAQEGAWSGGNVRWLSGALLGDTYGASAWRHEQGALADIGPHAFDLIDAALGRITRVPSAHQGANDLWHVLLEHTGGATSTVSMSLRLPVQPTVVEFAVYGEHGFRCLGRRPGSASESYTAMLDDFAAMIASGTSTHPCDVHRGLHLQRVLAEAHAAAARS